MADAKIKNSSEGHFKNYIHPRPIFTNYNFAYFINFNHCAHVTHILIGHTDAAVS